VPVVSRDFEGHALVAWHLRSRFGHDVRFCSAHDLQEQILSYAPDVLVLDRLDTRAGKARLAKRLGMKVVLLPTLGFVQDGLDTEELRAGKREGGRELLDCCFTWGERSRDLLVERGILDPEVVHAVGAARFDLYQQPYISLAQPRSELLAASGIVDDGSPLITWTTNTFHTLDGMRESAVARAVSTGVIERDFRAQIDDEGTAFDDISRAVAELARRHPDWRFLIKLHPSELAAPYESLAAGTNNVHVLRGASIRDVLHHSAALVTHCSTTATEAWMLGKPVLEVMFGNYQVRSPAEYMEGNHVVTEIAAMEALLEECVAGTAGALPEAQLRVRDEYLRTLYFRIDGQAGERCAEHIDALLAPARHDDAAHERIGRDAAQEYRVWKSQRDRRLSSRVRRALGIGRRQSLQFWTRSFWMQLLGRNEPRPWEVEVTPEMVRESFDRFDRAVRVAAGSVVRRNASYAVAR
jgi:surface carbohydrate biosynthesis protein